MRAYNQAIITSRMLYNRYLASFIDNELEKEIFILTLIPLQPAIDTGSTLPCLIN